MAGVGEQGGDRGDRDRPGVVEDEGEREGSLVDEGSSGEAESPGSGLGGIKGSPRWRVDKRGQGKRRRVLVRMKEMGGGIERDGSLVDEGSSGEAESSGSGLGGIKG